jgi:cytochrome P450
VSVRVARGEYGLPLIASANRDETQLPEPERFELHRERTGISFGAGSHS